MVVTDLLLSGPNGVVAFLREYKEIECNCCNEVVGFRHRVTGAVICTSTACSGQRGGCQPVVGSSTDAQLNNGTTKDLKQKVEEKKPVVGRVQEQASAPLLLRPQPRDAPSPRAAAIKKPDQMLSPAEKSEKVKETNKLYRHISSVHKYEDALANKPIPSNAEVEKAASTQKKEAVAKLIPSNVEVEKAASIQEMEAVDNKPGTSNVKVEKAAPTPKQDNPFFKNLPTTKKFDDEEDFDLEEETDDDEETPAPPAKRIY